MSTLKGRTALITGASRGIGRATAQRLARDGARIAVNYKGNAQAAEETKRLVEHVGSTATLVQGDVSVDADADRVVKEAVAFGDGKLDILVNNAGTNWGAPLAEYTDDAFQKVLATNVKSVFNLTRHPALTACAIAGNPWCSIQRCRCPAAAHGRAGRIPRHAPLRRCTTAGRAWSHAPAQR